MYGNGLVVFWGGLGYFEALASKKEIYRLICTVMVWWCLGCFGMVWGVLGRFGVFRGRRFPKKKGSLTLSMGKCLWFSEK